MRVVCPSPQRRVRPLLLFAGALAVALVAGRGAEERPSAQGCDPTLQNPIVCENLLPGSPASEWQVVGAGDATIQGFATDISVNRGSTVRFKIDTTATAYRIDIYRLGFYGGMGARKVATITPSAALPQRQPNCLSNASTGLIDCGNWGISASWAVPATAVSGLYIARPVRTDSGGASHIPFVVRDDTGGSDLLFQTSDTTWQAYNRYGGNSLYVGSSATAPDRAVKVSYNRPFTTREYAPEDWIFNAEYPMIRWLEANGYDVSYFTGVDADRFGAEILEHAIFLSVGHDEYWSGAQRANVEAARAANPPVHLAFFSGNEVFWKTRWEPSIDGTATGHRTLVSYKETHANGKIDPAVDPVTGNLIWTGTWRDPRFSPPGDGGRPENGLTGTIFKVNFGTSGIGVPAELGKHRFWRNTTVANLAAGTSVNLPTGTLGYEWDEAPNNGAQPPGLMRLSRRTVSGVETLLDYGNTYGPGSATHSLTLYRHESGSLVFGAGTVQWSWGLDSNHDRGSAAPDTRMRQATVNLFADMNVLPRTIQSGLVVTSPSSDTLAPASTIASPAAGASITPNTTVTVSGTAVDNGGGIVTAVEVSTDGGATWRPATGTANWTFAWVANATGPVTIQTRAWDDTGNRELPTAGVTVTVGSGTGEPKQCPCTIWSPTTTPSRMENDANAVEVGTRFRAQKDGFITGVRFYKYAQNTGTHVGSLWTKGGQKLATVTFTNETASGWQQANFSSPVAVTANTTYVVSYHSRVGFYAVNSNYFTTDVNNPPLRALFDGEDGANGVYLYTATGAFPTNTFQSENYWVDVVFIDNVAPDTTAPTVASTSPTGGTTNVPVTTNVTATFSERLDPATISGATFELRDSNNTLVPATVSYNDATWQVVLDPSANLKASATYTALLRGGTTDPRVKDVAGNPLAQSMSWTFNTSAAPPANDGCPCSIWPETTVPDHMQNDFNPVEVGVRFQSSVAGYIKGIRFYKYASNTGTHVGNLWSNAGERLATATFTNETASGWQEVLFDAAVQIAPNTTYVASYHAPNGAYASSNSYFASTAITRGPLTALQDSPTSTNGLYRYTPTSNAMPTDSFAATNYWVDVVFVSTLQEDKTAPVVTATVPGSGQLGVSISTAITATFSESLDPQSVSADTFTLHTPSGLLVPATVTYDDATLTATLVPTAPLEYATAYTALLQGTVIEPRITDAAGNPLETDHTWSFTTVDPPLPPPTVSIADVSALEGSNPVRGELRFVLTLSRESTEPVTVAFATGGGTATSGVDYTEQSGTLTFTSKTTSQTITVLLAADTLDEADETVLVTLSNPTNATLGTAQATGLIQDDDGAPSMNIDDVSVVEGNAGATNAVFTVSLSSASGLPVSVNYETANGTASAPNDYTITAGTLDFAPGSTTQTIVVPVIGDAVHEADETFLVNLSGAVNATLSRLQGTGTITNDDAAPSISVADVTLNEGNLGTAAATFVLTLSAPSDVPVSVSYATADGTAAAGSDYTAASGTASFAPGATTTDVTVTVAGDTMPELDDAFALNLTSPVNAVVVDGNATATIVNDDGIPSIVVSGVSVTEGNAGTVSATFVLTLSTASGMPVTVNYATADGTALAGADYVAGTGTASFAAGQTVAEVAVPVNGDLIAEADETFTLSLADASNATIATAQATGTIVNDEVAPSVSIADVSVNEGNTGTTAATFVLTLSAASELPVSVSYATADGTASAASDYTAASGTASFAPGATTTEVTVLVSGDVVRELDDTFSISLGAPVNVTLGDGEATATIVNDDVAPTMSVANVTVNEGQAGTTAATFVLSLSAISDLPVSVNYATADGTALALSDYTAVSGTASFAAGATTTEVTVLVAGDAVHELDETFALSLAEPVNATIADGEATATVANDDAAPSISIAAASVNEGAAGTTAATFVLTLSSASDVPVSVTYATTDGTAAAGSDYAAATGTASFAPGATTADVTVLVNGDAVNESDETFAVSLTNASNATIPTAEATGTIVNDDVAPSVAVSDVSVNEGNDGTTAATFVLSLSGASGLPASVSYATVDGTAKAGSDYAAASGTASFAPGATTSEVTVLVSGDTMRELDDTFSISLGTPVNVTLGDGEATATIVNDDLAPTISVADVTVNEGQSATTTATVVLSLSSASDLPVSVNYATADGTALAVSDYTAASGTASFAAGATTTEVTVLVAGDAVHEADETFVISLSEPVNATIADGNATATVVNDDATPSIAVSGASVIEGDAGTTIAKFVLTLSSASDLPVTVNYATADGTARAGTDYVAATGTASFAARETVAEVAVVVNGDTVNELDETFSLTLADATNAALAVAQATGTIANDDAAPSISIADVTLNEGDGPTSAATFVLTLSAASDLPVTVNYATVNGTATAGADYIAATGTASFAAGVTTTQVTVLVNGDVARELDETFQVNLSEAVNATLAQVTGTATIANDDAMPAVSIASVSVSEGQAGTAAATFVLTLSAPSDPPVSVNYATADGTAMAGSDYAATSGVASFAPGATTTEITVLVNGDAVNEQDETFQVSLTAATNATVGGTAATGTIVNDDAAPAISIADVSVSEGAAGTTAASFVLTLSAASELPVSVTYATADGTAAAGSDYAAASGTASFAPGTTTAEVTVLVTGDGISEANETFAVSLASASNATIATAQATGTIVNDDAAPTVSIAGASVPEGQAGTTAATFVLTLSAASELPVSVSYATADGTAVAGSDYIAASGTASFAPGATTSEVTILVNGDVLRELDDTFQVTLTNATNATVAGAQATGTIVNDDAMPVVSVAGVSVSEGQAGTTAATFTLTLSAASDLPVSVNYATADGTAIAGSDYAAASGVASFAPGATTTEVTVLVSGDAANELDEAFQVSLTAATNATVGGTAATGTIVNDDAAPSVAVADVSISEGAAGTTAATFVLTLSAASELPVSVTYATADGTAAAGSDYAAATGTASFAPGATTAEVTVLVNGDAINEANETFALSLANASNATVATAQATGTIVNDDAAPSVSIASVSVSEGQAGTTAATFLLTLSAASELPVSVTYATADGTAAAGSDYIAASGTASFAPGATTAEVTVLVNGDVLRELDDTFQVTLTNATNATVAGAQATGTIVNDDAMPVVSIAGVSASEGQAGIAAATFTLTLSAATDLPVSVNYATADGTAIAGSDYAAASGVASFAPGSTTVEVTVLVNGDAVNELDETFQLNLADAANATLGIAQAAGTIVNDDAAPSVSIANVSITEGAAGTAAATFVLTLSAASELPVSVTYVTADGTASAGSDYAAASGTASFAPGATTTEVTVLVNGDAVSELDETFSVSLADAVNATVAVAQAIGTIANDDAAPSISIGDVSLNEGSAGSVSATFVLTLSAVSELPVSVAYTTANGTAGAGSDYAASSGTASFPPGASTAEVIVPVSGDSLHELDETFTVSLTGPVNATVAVGQATGTIVNDDPAPAIAIADASVNEGSAGTKTATFTLTLSAASELPVTVSYATADGTGAAGADYVAASGTATFAPGATSATVSVLVNGDTIVESDETFLVLLADATNATIAQGQATGTVVNDDTAPMPDPVVVTMSIADASIAEGQGGSAGLTFTVSLSAASMQAVSVAYATSDGTATAGVDYVASAGTLTIPAGALSGTIVVPVINDASIEQNETLAVTLTSSGEPRLSRSVASGTIMNDDSLPGLVASYNFDLPDASVVRDTSGNELHGAISGAVWTEGHSGGAMSFDGVNDWVRIADDDRLDLPRMTIAAWVRPASGDAFDAVIAKAASTQPTYVLYSSNGARRPSADFSISSNMREVEGPTTIPANAWTHVAASFDGARIRLYVNGVLVRIGVRTGAIDASTGALGIGGHQSLGHFFAGVIDDVRIYNRALLDSEVHTDMNTPVP